MINRNDCGLFSNFAKLKNWDKTPPSSSIKTFYQRESRESFGIRGIRAHWFWNLSERRKKCKIWSSSLETWECSEASDLIPNANFDLLPRLGFRKFPINFLDERERYRWKPVFQVLGLIAISIFGLFRNPNRVFSEQWTPNVRILLSDLFFSFLFLLIHQLTGWLFEIVSTPTSTKDRVILLQIYDFKLLAFLMLVFWYIFKCC